MFNSSSNINSFFLWIVFGCMKVFLWPDFPLEWSSAREITVFGQFYGWRWDLNFKTITLNRLRWFWYFRFHSKVFLNTFLLKQKLLKSIEPFKSYLIFKKILSVELMICTIHSFIKVPSNYHPFLVNKNWTWSTNNGNKKQIIYMLIIGPVYKTIHV